MNEFFLLADFTAIPLIPVVSFPGGITRRNEPVRWNASSLFPDWKRVMYDRINKIKSFQINKYRLLKSIFTHHYMKAGN